MESGRFTASTIRQWARPGFLSLLAALAFAGCQTHSISEKPLSVGWEDHRFPNYPRPYDKLLVEIDAVEGTQPKREELEALETFLARSTAKPGGVTVKLDNIIPRELARQRGPDALALEYLNGPADERTAFLYIFCYRSKLAGWGVKPDNPQFTYFPYPCSVFIDRSYLGFYGLFHRKVIRRAILLHEAGHALGLARNSDHTKDGHCINAGCLMRPHVTFHFRRFLTLRQPWGNTSFCADCERDLESFKTASPKPNERLWHGYFVHEKTGYQILTLPGFVYVHFGAATELSKGTLDDVRRATIADMNRKGTTFTATTNSIDPAQHTEALTLLLREKNDVLHALAKGIFEKGASLAESLAESEPEAARGLTSEAILSATKELPEIQAKLQAVRRKLTEAIAAGSETKPTTATLDRSQ
jgi:hypothetical protein